MNSARCGRRSRIAGWRRVWGARGATGWGNWLVDVEHRAHGGPVPEPLGVFEVYAQAAVCTRIPEVGRPVVVVNSGAVAGEILRKQHVLQEVAAGRIARRA